ncbi:uncharacterized protein LOC114532367 [Dendronephthya gigantea]|uniref:uncharacterized protein LOC114532367 n=1 Tax=Dendronephthya gigantea TaxID=151771 RepID=UPI00106DC97D|nr:uncharacterized protein LOC114532367 [Dendronephthya gigantea]
MDEKSEQGEEMMKEDLVLNILKQLQDIIKRTHENKEFKNEIAGQLIKNGYDYFSANVDEINPSHVIKILQVAIDNTMTTKLDLTQQAELDDEDEDDAEKMEETLEKKLGNILEINDGKCLQDYWSKGWKAMLPTARSPLDLAKHVKKSAPLWLVKNLLKYQFRIKWATKTGLPSCFSFYEFCEAQGNLKHLKYKPKKAQVRVELYHESLKRSGSEIQLGEEQLCPLVYIKTTSGWKTWRADGGKIGEVRGIEEFKWIHESVRNYILENADEMRGDSEEDQSRKEATNLQKALDKPALFWLVVNDEFQTGPSSQLREICHTQVFVGKADNGIRRAWIEDTGSHGDMMKRCAEHVRSMTTYDPLRLKGISLVDARLVLAKLRGDKCGVFLLKTFGDDSEKAIITKEKAAAVCVEANTEWKKSKKVHAEITEKLKKAKQSQQPDRIKELRRAKRASEMSKEILDQAAESVKNAQQAVLAAESAVVEITREETGMMVQSRLKTAEARHKEGKRIKESNMNIIPYDNEGNKLVWKPKNMAFGMNK